MVQVALGHALNCVAVKDLDHLKIRLNNTMPYNQLYNSGTDTEISSKAQGSW